MNTFVRTICTFAMLSGLVGAGAIAAPPAAPAAVAPAPAPPTWAQLPAAVRDTIKKELGVEPAADKISGKPNKEGKVEYGAGAEVGKKNIKVKVSAAGVLIQRREKEDIGEAGLPKPIAKAAKKELGKAVIKTAHKVTKDAEVTYVVTAELKDRTYELVLNADGSFVEKVEAQKKPEKAPTAAAPSAGAMPVATAKK